ncbi:hypothetical protein J9303_18175 [Bacillaceae bacterium Marseille-Q3522]|nr:hypothetical protein [Bacillaceae bacterium Marseille-Q3522]
MVLLFITENGAALKKDNLESEFSAEGKFTLKLQSDQNEQKAPLSLQNYYAIFSISNNYLSSKGRSAYI